MGNEEGIEEAVCVCKLCDFNGSPDGFPEFESEKGQKFITKKYLIYQHIAYYLI